MCGVPLVWVANDDRLRAVEAILAAGTECHARHIVVATSSQKAASFGHDGMASVLRDVNEDGS